MAVFFARRNHHTTQTQEFEDDRSIKRIGVALFNGFSLPEAAAVAEIFQSANALCMSTHIGGLCYDVHFLSVEGGRIASSSSVFVWTDTFKSGGRTDDFHAFFIVVGAGVHTMLSKERLTAWLHRLDLRSDLVFPTERRLPLDFPESPAITRKLLRGEGAHAVAWNGSKVSNSQRSITPLRAPLAMIEEDLGAEIAREIASSLRLRFEAQFTSVRNRNVFAAVSEKIQSSAQWFEMNCSRPITIEEAAQFVAMSERNFLRRFKMEMGTTPSDYLLYVRIEKCCRLLLETDLPVDKIARRCGMRSGGQLSKVFRRYLGATPTEYRTRKQSFSQTHRQGVIDD